LVRPEPPNGLHTVEFLRHLVRYAGRRLLIVWDRSPIHRRANVTDFVAAVGTDSLRVEPLPAYAPDLNPVEQLWNYLRYVELANFVPAGVLHLNCLVEAHLEVTGQEQGRLRSFYHASELPLPQGMAIAS
jgi:transposase